MDKIQIKRSTKNHTPPTPTSEFKNGFICQPQIPRVRAHIHQACYLASLIQFGRVNLVTSVGGKSTKSRLAILCYKCENSAVYDHRDTAAKKTEH